MPLKETKLHSQLGCPIVNW